MAAGKDRVKEGRSRIGLLIGDDLLEAVDFIAELEGSSRSQILQFFVIDALDRRQYFASLRKYPDFLKYRKECMASRPKGTVYEGQHKAQLIMLTAQKKGINSSVMTTNLSRA